MRGWNDVGQFVPGQRRQQARGRLVRLRCDLDQVVVDLPLAGKETNGLQLMMPTW
jgi:hypothetical protein